MNQYLTEREREALSEIVRRGGSLPGGRQNTQVTNRLIAKGYATRVADARDVIATPAGLAQVETQEA